MMERAPREMIEEIEEVIKMILPALNVTDVVTLLESANKGKQIFFEFKLFLPIYRGRSRSRGRDRYRRSRSKDRRRGRSRSGSRSGSNSNRTLSVESVAAGVEIQNMMGVGEILNIKMKTMIAKEVKSETKKLYKDVKELLKEIKAIAKAP